QVCRCRRLGGLVHVVALEVAVADLCAKSWDRSTVKALFDALEFHSMWDDLEAAIPSHGAVTETMSSEAELVSAADRIAALAGQETLVMGLAADDFGLTVSTGPDQAAVIPWDAAGPILDSVSDGR